MLIAGIGTLIQLFPIWRVGSGLPIVMGISFTFVSILCFIGTTYGYETIVGAVLVGGILEGTLGLFAKYWLKWISPIVAASVVTAIGFLCCRLVLLRLAAEVEVRTLVRCRTGLSEP